MLPTIDDTVRIDDGPLKGLSGVVCDGGVRNAVLHFEVWVDAEKHWLPDEWLRVLPRSRTE